MLRSLLGGGRSKEATGGDGGDGEGSAEGEGSGTTAGFRDKRRGERVTAARKALDQALEMLNDPANHIGSVGIARKAIVTQAEEIVLAAVQTLEDCQLAKALSKEEQRDMERLKGHELGAKADPAKFKRVYTEDKKFILFQYKLRVEISQQIRNTLKVLKTAKDSHALAESAQDTHNRARLAMEFNNLSEAYRLCKEAEAAYRSSGFSAESAADHEVLRKQVLKLSAAVLQKVFRGHMGRKEYREQIERKQFEGLRWQLEASTLFKALDVDNSGTVNRSELQVGLVHAGFSSREAANFFDKMDQDGSNEIDEAEFCEAFHHTLAHGTMNSGDVSSNGPDPLASESELDSFGRRLESETSTLPERGGGTMGPAATGCTSLRFGEIHFAAQRGDVVRLWGLLVKGKVNVDSLTSNGFSALHFAAMEGQAPTILALGALGVNPNLLTRSGYTAMHAAAGKNRVDAIKALARIRAKISLPDTAQEATPLHWAAREGHLAALEALIELGSHPEFVDRAGNSALLYAARHGHISVVQRLVKLGAKLTGVPHERAPGAHTISWVAFVALQAWHAASMCAPESARWHAASMPRACVRLSLPACGFVGEEKLVPRPASCTVRYDCQGARGVGGRSRNCQCSSQM